MSFYASASYPNFKEMQDVLKEYDQVTDDAKQEISASSESDQGFSPWMGAGFFKRWMKALSYFAGAITFVSCMKIFHVYLSRLRRHGELL